jgi:hypothetical protein
MRELTYAQAINEALMQNLEKNERVFLMGEDIGEYGGIFQVRKTWECIKKVCLIEPKKSRRFLQPD